jgi:NAD-dependent dihydropyrimidine dehydrogenase PreA subunit
LKAGDYAQSNVEAGPKRSQLVNVFGLQQAQGLLLESKQRPLQLNRISEAAQDQGRLPEMAYVIAEPCIGTKDTACVDACPVDCIHPKKDEAGHGDTDQLFIDPVECIDCGACVPVCPVSAIYAGDDLPEKWAAFQQKNADHYGR